VFLAAAMAFVWSSGPLQAAVKVGKTELIVKKVTGELAQSQRLLALKDTVFQDELIAAATASASRIVFLDGTELSVGPNTEITLDRFVFDPDEGSVTIELNVVEGVFRFISGRFANAFKSDYKVKTPTATLGMRGTVVTAVVASDGTTATMLGSPSIVTVEGLSGEIVTLDMAGISATSMPDGSVSPPGPAPDWALEAVRQMDMLLADAFDFDTLDHETAPTPPSEAATPPDISPPTPDINIPAPDVTPAPDIATPAPPAPNPAPGLEGLGLARANAVADDHAINGGLGNALSVGDTNAEGMSDHGRGVGSGAPGEGAAGPGGGAGAAGGAGGGSGAANGGGPGVGNGGSSGAGNGGSSGAGNGSSSGAGNGGGPGAANGSDSGAGNGGGRGGENGGGRGGANAGGRGGGVGAANAGGSGGNGNGNGNSK
jgi:hypothetical protein